MNIIISSLDANGIHFTGPIEAVDIDSLKLFISKKIKNTDSILIELVGNQLTYVIEKVRKTSLEKNDYYGFQLLSRVPVLNDSYQVVIKYNDDSIPCGTITVENKQQLEDEHDPVLVVGRKIGEITSPIVAQDANSQQIEFFIKRKYDGISFLDESKIIYIDYVPVDKKTSKGEPVEFLSDKIKEIFEVQPPAGYEGEWLLLKWTLPYEATRLAGEVKYAISVIDMSNDTRIYTWQTFPSSFVVHENIGFRQEIVLTPEDESKLTELVREINTLKENVLDIENILGYQTDSDSDNDVEIIFSGGTAPIDN